MPTIGMGQALAADSEKSDWYVQDDGYGNEYYCNATTGETSWDKPEEFHESTGSGAVGQWVSQDDGYGSSYYYNTETQETSWEPPADHGNY
jgi:hypothetical protein